MNILQEETWTRSLHEKKQRLQKLGRDNFVENLNFSSFQPHIEQMMATYELRRGMKIFSTVNPVIEHIKSFHSAISTLVQSHPEIAALVWGVAQLLFEVI